MYFINILKLFNILNLYFLSLYKKYIFYINNILFKKIYKNSKIFYNFIFIYDLI